MIATTLRKWFPQKPADAPREADRAAAGARNQGSRRYEDRRFDPPAQSRRILLYGGCLAETLVKVGRRGIHSVDHLLFLSGLHEEPSAPPLGAYDAAVIVLSLRTVLGQAAERLVGFHDADLLYQKDLDPQAVQDAAVGILDGLVDKFLQCLQGVAPFFVLGFVEPPPTSSGLFQARRPGGVYRLVRALNDHLAMRLDGARSGYFLEVNDLLRAYGDADWYDGFEICFTHGNLWSPPVDRDSPHAAILRRIDKALAALHLEQPVKLIITDLDDTLWKGVLAETDEIVAGDHTEGWPIGYAEALIECKRRGILLAISSKNDDATTRANFAKVWYGRIRIEDFCAVKINWQPKSANVAEILREVNLLPENVVFIDDNPLEIAEVKRAYPAIRTLSGDPKQWRMELLYGVPFQVVRSTDESARRTELIQAKILRDRELTQPQTDRAGYLQDLGLRVTVRQLGGAGDADAARALELLNKTNQFNTTGRRWTAEEFGAFLAHGGQLHAMRAADRLADHGLIGLGLVKDEKLVQMVLSCRVFGLELEDALLHHIALTAGAPEALQAQWRETDRNATARQFLQRHFFPERDGWRLQALPSWPGHIGRTA